MIKIDPLSFLLLIEALLILLVISITLALRSRKKRDIPRTHFHHDMSETSEKEKPDDQTGEQAPEKDPQNDAEKLRQTLEMLKRMIQDMLNCRTVFDTSPVKLAALQNSCHELWERTGRGPAAAGGEDQKQSGMESEIGTLKAEQETLAIKFRIWEEQFSKIQGDSPAAPVSADDGIRTMVSEEKESLLGKVRSAEEALSVRDKLLEALQKKYENLEKEYEILYRQQQSQSG